MDSGDSEEIRIEFGPIPYSLIADSVRILLVF